MSSLDLVLKLRSKKEEEAFSDYGKAKSNLELFIQKLNQLRDFKATYIQEMQSYSQAKLDMQTYLSYKNFIAKLESIEEQQGDIRLKLENELSYKHSLYLKARQERKIIEELIDKQKRDAILKQTKVEQKLADELVSVKFAQKLTKRG